MEIVYEYKKKRRQFGRRPQFTATEPAVLYDSKPVASLAKQYTTLNPISRGVQSLPELSGKEVNTAVKDFEERGMLHLEGGWPAGK